MLLAVGGVLRGGQRKTKAVSELIVVFEVVLKDAWLII
jgi:hypothetical protein